MRQVVRTAAVAIVAIIAAANLLSTSKRAHAQTLSSIKVVQWNVEDGQQSGEIDAIVAQQPDIVFLQEVDDPVGHMNAMITALEGHPHTGWDVPRYVSRYNTTAVGSSYSWIVILSRFPMSNIKTVSLGSDQEVICGVSTDARAAIGATIEVGGKPLAIFSTRNFWASGDCPAAEQNRRFKAWADAEYPSITHLYGGDFNMTQGGIAYEVMMEQAPTSVDAWAEAVQEGTATAEGVANPNFDTPTKGNRIDYLLYKNAGTVLDATSAHISGLFSGISDHRMAIATFNVTAGPPPPPPPPPSDTIVDNFDDNSLDTALWIRDNVFSGSTQMSIPITEINQRLEIGPIPANTTGYNGIRTQPMAFSGKYAQVRLVQTPASSAAFSMFTVGDSDTHYRFWVQGSTLTCEEKINGTKTYPCTVSYNPTAHQFLRITHDAAIGQVSWQVAPANGAVPGQWTTLTSSVWNTTYLPLSSVMFELKAGTATAEAISPGTAAFDSFASGPATTPTEVVVLEDEFDGATLGSDWIVSNLFSGSTDSTIAVNQANQHLEIGPLPTNDTGYNGIRTTARDMTNGYAQVRLVQAASASSTAYAMLTIGNASTHYRFWVQGSTLTCEEKINGVKTYTCGVTYDVTAHRFLRISHNAATGQVVFEAAPASGSGPGQWAVLYSGTWNATYLPANAVMFELKAGSSSLETVAPGTVAFDSFRAARRQ